MRTSRTFLGPVLVASAVLALLGGAVATAQTDDDAAAPTGAAPEELVDRLVDLELDLGAGTLAVDLGIDPETGALQGDFVGLQVLLETESDRIRTLFIDADESDGPVAMAVSDVARSFLTLENVARRLAAFEDFDLERTLGTTDDDGVATGADALVGQLEIGIASYEDAVLRAWPAYDVLRNATEADDAERDLFDDDFAALQVVLDEEVPVLREVVSGPTTAVIVPVERFDATVGEARSRSVTVTCIDRSIYALEASDEAVPPGEEAQPYGDPFAAADCPDLPTSDDAGLQNRVTTGTP